MIALFLWAELASSRFGVTIGRQLRSDGMPDRIITVPDLASAAENRYRRQLIGVCRGFGHDTDLFHGFPAVVGWQWMALGPTELRQVHYINYDYWIELSGGSRLPEDAAERIRTGIEVFGVSSQGFFAAAERLVFGAAFPELILVSAGENSKLVVLEGHLRLTAYLLEPHAIPPELKVLVGTSPDFVNWPLY